MPGQRISGDRRFLMVVGGITLVVLAATVLLTAGGRAESSGYPSSYSTASDGALAAFLLLRELDFEVERWEQPPTELPQQPKGMTLILAEPFLPPDAAEQNALRQFAAKGGTILATGLSGARLLPGGAAVWKPEDFEWQDLKPQLPSVLGRGVDEIRMDVSMQWFGKPDALVVFGQKDQGVVVTYRHGEGRIVWWSAATPLTNGGIAAKQNLRFFFNSIGAEQQSRIFWDEYFHGVRRSLWAYLRSTPVPWGLAQVFAVFGLALFTFARRHGPLRAPAMESRLDPLEFVKTLGSLYQSSKAAPASMLAIYQRFRYRMLRQMGLPSAAGPKELAAAIKTRHGDTAELEETLLAAEKSATGPLTADEAVRICRRLQEYAQQLRLDSQAERRNR